MKAMLFKPTQFALVLAAAAASWSATAQAPGIPALDKLSSGLWEVRFRDSAPTRRFCLRDGRELVQLRHSAPGCTRSLVSNEPAVAVFQYSCRGAGYGRTTIRRETPSLAQVTGQGIAHGRPFDFTAEARRVGGCT